MEDNNKQCNHVIGVCHNNSYGGAGTPSPLKISQAQKAVADARGFYEARLDAETYNMRYDDARAFIEKHLAAFDKKPFLVRLKKNSTLYKYCSSCGAALSSVLSSLGDK